MAVSATGFHVPNFHINTALDSEVFSFNVYIGLGSVTDNVIAIILTISGSQVIKDSFHILFENGSTHADTETIVSTTSDAFMTLERSVIYVQQLAEPGDLKAILTVAVGSPYVFTKTYPAYISLLLGTYNMHNNINFALPIYSADPCDHNPCENGGTCSGNGVCTCSQGYTGPTCSVPVDYCEASPCLNGGTCTNELLGFQCSCMNGYTGIICEVDIDDCEGVDCGNGVCADGLAAYTCECVPGYIGSDCMEDINECLLCVNATNCTDLVNELVCECLLGFTGKYCNETIDYCEPNPCDPVGSSECISSIGTFTCECFFGFSGATCSIDIDNCESEPCQNGGNCTDLPLGLYDCDCPSGFDGQNCEDLKDPCLQTPCSNGATCVRLGSSTDFTCMCAAGYTGQTCSEEINECSSNPCKNDGTCIDKINDFECQCAPGYLIPHVKVMILILHSVSLTHVRMEVLVLKDLVQTQAATVLLDTMAPCVKMTILM